MFAVAPHAPVNLSLAYAISYLNVGVPESTQVMDCHERLVDGGCEDGLVKRDCMVVTANVEGELKSNTVDEFISNMGFTVSDCRGERVMLSDYLKLVGNKQHSMAKNGQRGKRELKNLS